MNEPFKLDLRLMLCASFVRQDAKVADIGTDHAYLPVWLCKKGIAKSALACDIGQEPLQNGIKTIEKYNACDVVEARLCNGLSAIEENEVDDIIIAGMGGETIADIIGSWKYSKNPKKHFILQPMTKPQFLINFLYSNGFEIIKQECCFDKKLYTVMLVEYTGNTFEITEEFLHLGKLSPKTNPFDREYLEMEIRNLENKAKGNKEYIQVIENLKKEL